MQFSINLISNQGSSINLGYCEGESVKDVARVLGLRSHFNCYINDQDLHFSIKLAMDGTFITRTTLSNPEDLATAQSTAMRMRSPTTPTP
jgi:hypothetical protein